MEGLWWTGISDIKEVATYYGKYCTLVVVARRFLDPSLGLLG